MQLYEWLDEWLDIYAQNKVKTSTYQNYAWAIQKAKSRIDDRSLEMLLEMDGQKALNSLALEGFSKSSIDKVRIVLKDAMHRAVKNKMIADNPFDDLFIPKYAPEKRVRPLTIEEQKNVESACKETLHGDLYIMLLYTGVRRQELCDFQWSDYDEQNETIIVRGQKTKNSRRVIPLLPICQRIINSQPKFGEYIFYGIHGDPITASVLKKLYLRLRKITGIETITNHVARHTFATRLLEAGVDEKAISTLLGHSSTAFTMDQYVEAQTKHLKTSIYQMCFK